MRSSLIYMHMNISGRPPYRCISSAKKMNTGVLRSNNVFIVTKIPVVKFINQRENV